MRKSLFFWQTLGFFFTCIAGVLLHFLFDWTNQSILISPFSAINESIWEHMKLLFFPMLLYALLEKYYIGVDYENFWCVKLIGIISGTILIPVMYYTINGILGSTADWVNIAIFFITAGFSYFMEARLFSKNNKSCDLSETAFLIFFSVGILFVIMTFFPPHIPLFQDPITKTSGYWKTP